MLTLIVLWFCETSSRFGVLSSRQVLSAFLRPPRNVVAPQRLAREFYSAALPGSPFGIARWWWPSCLAAVVLTVALPVLSMPSAIVAMPLLLTDAMLTVVWAISVCLFKLLRTRVDVLRSSPVNHGLRCLISFRRRGSQFGRSHPTSCRATRMAMPKLRQSFPKALNRMTIVH